MIGKLLTNLWIILWLGSLGGDNVSAYHDPVILDERLDELHDAEIFQAVVDSMRQWELHKKTHRAKREVSRVCYEDVGCFEDAGPFSYLEMLPSPPKDVGTRFLVYGSRKARSIPTEVPAEDINEKVHHAIDPELPTKVIVHGFGSSCDHVWVYEMRSALMSVHECNIVCVDWGPGSAVPNYVRAAANTRLVGRQLAKLVKSLNVPLEKIHLIGFSLGAHVAGFAGAELGNVSRITGLDPAGPLFEYEDQRARLDETDAHFVDVIHSNGEQLILGGLGSWQPMGDVDFYPNGGRMQSGCSNLFLGAVSDIIWSSAVEGRSLCNHRRAYKLFTDSVSPSCRFPAFACEYGYEGLLKGECFPCGPDRPCGDMGYYSDTSAARGLLYLITRDEEPFCAHQYQVKVYNSRGERSTRSYGKLQVMMVGKGSFNETFTMTRKDDEELVVGDVLQKIVVPHPSVSNLEAVEVKYTAYSGWISSGLATWNIDKVTITDSFGKTQSVCKRSLTLESGRPVYLPLYPGDCNIPQETDTDQSMSNTESVSEKVVQEQPKYEKEVFPMEVHEQYSSSQKPVQKNIGPFTRSQNMKFEEKDDKKVSVENVEFVKENSKAYQSSPWSFVDLSNDGSSNSLENSDSEKGRGFAGLHFVHKTSTSTHSFEPTTESVHPPMIRSSKKENGRSLKLPEITEPILRPRPARQNTKDTYSQDKKQEILEESPSSRAFTVQFLPEKIAGFLAQAERYARQTLFPLISQYTPSFVGGNRGERPKYFPPLSSFFDSSPKTTQVPMEESGNSEKKGRNIITKDTPTKSESKNESVSTERSLIDLQDTDWVPVDGSKIFNITKVEKERFDDDKSYGGKWLNEDGGSWGPQVEDANANPETMIDNWAKPINDKNEVKSTTEDELKPFSEISPVTEATKLSLPELSEPTSSYFDEGLPPLDSKESFFPVKSDRKFIPLKPDLSAFKSTTSNDIESTSTEKMMTHIQKIPKRGENKPTEKTLSAHALPFPYQFDQNQKTKYIPLIPEREDSVSPVPFHEKSR